MMARIFFFGLLISLHFLEGAALGQGWEERLSQWNPMGKWLTPLKEAVPGLDVKGFLRYRPRLDLHGQSDSVGPGVRKNYDFSMHEWRAELEVRYKLGPELELVNIDNFLYDAFFDWEDSPGGSWNKEPYRTTRRTRHYYRTTDRILRELYLDWYPGNWWLRLGKQQVAWGKMLSKVIDVINPSDNWSGVFDTSDNFEWTRIPTWMASATYYFRESYFQFMWIPDFEPNARVPSAREGNPFGPMTPPPSGAIATRSWVTDKPSASFKNHELALNLNTKWRKWDISLFYFYHWDDSPTPFRRAFSPKGEIDPFTRSIVDRDTFYTERKPTRLHTLGAAVEKQGWMLNRNWVSLVEVNYTMNDYFVQAKPAGMSNREWFRIDPNGVTKRNWISAAWNINANFFQNELKAFLQLAYDRTFGWDDRLRGTRSGNDRRDNFLFAIGLSKQFAFTNDKLGMAVIHSYREDGDMAQRVEMSYKVSDYLYLLGRYYWFAGNSDDPWGQMDDKDMLHFELKYSF